MHAIHSGGSHRAPYPIAAPVADTHDARKSIVRQAVDAILGGGASLANNSVVARAGVAVYPVTVDAVSENADAGGVVLPLNGYSVTGGTRYAEAGDTSHVNAPRGIAFDDSAGHVAAGGRHIPVQTQRAALGHRRAAHGEIG